jgi:hypothetical protein
MSDISLNYKIILSLLIMKYLMYVVQDSRLLDSAKAEIDSSLKTISRKTYAFEKTKRKK